MLHCNIDERYDIPGITMQNKSAMSPQLAVSAAFSVFAFAALALFAPMTERSGAGTETGAAIEIATPALPSLPAFIEAGG